jgi:hypothetical protein
MPPFLSFLSFSALPPSKRNKKKHFPPLSTRKTNKQKNKPTLQRERER